MQACAIAFTVLKYIILLMLYVGALGVVYGIITFEPPKGTWPEGKKFPVAPAVQCTMILACQYFIVYGGMQIARTWTQFTGIAPNFPRNGHRIASSCTLTHSLRRHAFQLQFHWFCRAK